MFWTFELGSQEGIKVPIWKIVAFQHMERQDSQKLNNDTLHWLPATSAGLLIGTEIYPDSHILIIYSDDDYSQDYGQIKKAFRALSKDDLLTSYILQNDY